jgi:thymidylate synthase (FAD)
MKIAQIAVELIDSMGDDLRVVNAARVSHDKESKWENVPFEMADPRPDGTFPTRLSDKDAKLIKYLVEHNHWTPFAHCFASFCINVPIFVARQLVKHLVGIGVLPVMNEVSRRYVDDGAGILVPESMAQNVQRATSSRAVAAQHA